MTTPHLAPTKVTLRLLEKTDREIVRLHRTIVGAVYKFQHDFRANPRHPGLRLKRLEGHDRLYSARVNADYRALLLRLSESEWLLVSVKHRGHAYENLDRLSYGINSVTGSIDYVDLEIVPAGTRSSAVRRRDARAAGRPGCGRTAYSGRRAAHYRRGTSRPGRVRAPAHRRGAAAVA